MSCNYWVPSHQVLILQWLKLWNLTSGYFLQSSYEHVSSLKLPFSSVVGDTRKVAEANEKVSAVFADPHFDSVYIKTLHTTALGYFNTALCMDSVMGRNIHLLCTQQIL